MHILISFTAYFTLFHQGRFVFVSKNLFLVLSAFPLAANFWYVANFRLLPLYISRNSTQQSLTLLPEKYVHVFMQVFLMLDKQQTVIRPIEPRPFTSKTAFFRLCNKGQYCIRKVIYSFQAECITRHVAKSLKTFGKFCKLPGYTVCQYYL